MTPSTDSSSAIAVDDAIRAFAFIGDLSMGRPTDQSLRKLESSTRAAATLKAFTLGQL